MAWRSVVNKIDGVDDDSLNRLSWYRFLNVISFLLLLVALMLSAYLYHTKVYSGRKVFLYDCKTQSFTRLATNEYSGSFLRELSSAQQKKCIKKDSLPECRTWVFTSEKDQLYDLICSDTRTAFRKMGYRTWSFTKLVDFAGYPLLIIVGSVIVVVVIRRATIYVKKC